MKPSLSVRVAKRAQDTLALLRFLRRRRSVWLAVLVAALLVLTAALYVVQSAAVAPYIYPLF